jgi:protein-S-isoprenylcysteine O-methyltransferase Ste14
MVNISYARERTALLFVDPYNDFLSDGGKLWPLVEGVAKQVGLHKNLRSITAAIRKAGIQIFFVPHRRWEPGDYESWDHPNPDQVASGKIHAGTKGWDKGVLVFLLLSFLAIYPLAGLDSRYQWSSVPPWLIVLGYVLLSLGMIGSIWAYSVNKFAEPGGRIQTEPGHKVFDTRPYAIVRHHIYVAGFLIVAGTPVALGSLWALIPVAVTSPSLIVRTAFEDRLLQDELGGYKEYASRAKLVRASFTSVRNEAGSP